ncbi:hypothetical protein [Cupriavidus alkaliphilus]|uniref:hypothetical protein n=1 Tax=Cupriavidus alkaliphilus TaxID=942866 RepID=UPI00339D9A8B
MLCPLRMGERDAPILSVPAVASGYLSWRNADVMDVQQPINLKLGNQQSRLRVDGELLGSKQCPNHSPIGRSLQGRAAGGVGREALKVRISQARPFRRRRGIVPFLPYVQEARRRHGGLWNLWHLGDVVPEATQTNVPPVRPDGEGSGEPIERLERVDRDEQIQRQQLKLGLLPCPFSAALLVIVQLQHVPYQFPQHGGMVGIGLDLDEAAADCASYPMPPLPVKPSMADEPIEPLQACRVRVARVVLDHIGQALVLSHLADMAAQARAAFALPSRAGAL